MRGEVAPVAAAAAEDPSSQPNGLCSPQWDADTLLGYAVFVGYCIRGAAAAAVNHGIMNTA